LQIFNADGRKPVDFKTFSQRVKTYLFANIYHISFLNIEGFEAPNTHPNNLPYLFQLWLCDTIISDSQIMRTGVPFSLVFIRKGGWGGGGRGASL
jgi:hypothetical protein